jgi:hypothetical protein
VESQRYERQEDSSSLPETAFAARALEDWRTFAMHELLPRPKRVRPGVDWRVKVPGSIAERKAVGNPRDAPTTRRRCSTSGERRGFGRLVAF